MRRLRRFVVLMIGAAQAGCGEGGSTGPSGEPALVEIAPSAPDTLFSIGDSLRLTTVVKDADANVVSSAPVTFKSSATAVATVSNDGIVVSAGSGAATITATSGSAEGSVPIRVRQKLTVVEIDPATLRLGVSRTRELKVEPADARGNPMTGLPAPAYSSSNGDVAVVNANGEVMGVDPGNATVTASIDSPADGTHRGNTEIVVVSVAASATVTLGATTFSPATVDIERGGTVTFVNGSGTAHDVDFAETALDIPVHSAGSNTRGFGTAGTFAYHCNLHGGMTGTVFVH